MKGVLFCALLAAPMWAQMAQTTKSGCVIVKLADAVSVLGPGIQQREFQGNCIYGTKIAAVTANLTPDAGTLFNVMKYTAAQSPGAVVKDEPTIGEYAFSVTPKEGTGFTIFLLKGTWGATINLSTGTAKSSEAMKNGLRRVAKVAMSRM